MPYYFYTWTPEIVEHLAEHGVTPEEFEQIVGNPSHEEVSRSSANPIAFGLRPREDICVAFISVSATTQLNL